MLSRSGIGPHLECTDWVVDHMLQNSICKLRKLPHIVHHMVQLTLLTELLYLKNQKYSLNPQISLSPYCHGFHDNISQAPCYTLNVNNFYRRMLWRFSRKIKVKMFTLEIFPLLVGWYRWYCDVVKCKRSFRALVIKLLNSFQ